MFNPCRGSHALAMLTLNDDMLRSCDVFCARVCCVPLRVLVPK